MDELTEIQNWYSAHCNGDWEHQNGVEIDTLDNPGWSINIPLVDLSLLADKVFETVDVKRAEQDWIHATVEKSVFKACGGPHNLREMLRIFLDWAKD
jgi:hypothetical protein